LQIQNYVPYQQCTAYWLGAMMTLRQTYLLVRKWRKTGKSQKSFSWIAKALGISKPEARRLEDPKHIPGLRVQRQLGINEVCTTCKRHISKHVVKVVIPKIGTPGWLAYYLKSPFKEIK